MFLTHPAGNKRVRLPYRRQQTTDMVHRPPDTVPHSSRSNFLVTSGNFICHQEFITLPCGTPSVSSNAFPYDGGTKQPHLLWKGEHSVVECTESVWDTPAGR